MTTEIAVALIGGSLSLIGVIITVIMGNKKTEKSVKEQTNLTIYRIDQLEKKVEKHNGVIERVYLLERADAVEKEALKVINHRIKDLEGFHKKEE